jgi:peptidoglycan L-alanyl-D-glutamate endopeptidase CwlK
MSRRLEDLKPHIEAMARQWLALAKAQGLDPLVTCTLRTAAEQTALYAQGRTKPGDIVTWAKAGESSHQYGLALDFVPMVNGKIEWSAKHPHWQQLGELAESVGFEWAGRWPKNKREFPHIQQRDWKAHV